MTREQKRDELANNLEHVISILTEEIKKRCGQNVNYVFVDEMLQISDRITRAAEVLAMLYGIEDLEEQIAMLERALREADI